MRKDIIAASLQLKRATSVIIGVYMIAAQSFIPISNVSAATNVLYITPDQSQMNIDTTFCIDIASYVDSDANPGTTSGRLSYNSSLLQLLQIKSNGKKCPDTQGNELAPSYYSNRTVTTQNGAIDFDGSQSQADSGIRYIFAAIFKTKASGTASLSFSNDSLLNNIQPTRKGGSFTITAPKPTSTPKPTSKPSTSPSNATPTPSLPTPDPSKVKTPTNTVVIPETKTDPTGLIDSVNANPAYNSGSITWKVNASNPSSTMSYGTSYGQLDQKADVIRLADGTYRAALTNLLPGTYYHFSISSKGKGVEPGNYSSSFVTNGYPVEIKVTENNIPVQNAQIQIGEQSLTVNNGSITVGLAAGNYSGRIQTDTASQNINLTVKDLPVPSDGSTPEVQQFGPYNLSSAPLSGGPGSSFSIFAFIGVLLGGTILLAFGFIIFMNYRRHKFESESPSSTLSSTVVIEDGYDWQHDDSHTAQNTPATSPSLVSAPNLQNPQHINSVHLTEEEPLDMFERSNLSLSPLSPPSEADPAETQQNPN